MGEITPQPGVTPPMPQNTVVFNGSAINLVTQLVDGIRRDMQVMKVDLTTTIDARFDQHEEMHEIIRTGDLDFQRRARERLTELEGKDIADARVAADKAAFKAGQMSLFSGLVTIAKAIEEHGKWIAIAILTLAAVLASAIGDVHITFGS